jgi:predicted metal-dependent phosphoesterase TrpH
MIDLHIHTIASSDGQHTPHEIFTMAQHAGLKAIAFADHNSIGSVKEGIALAKAFNIEFIPCLELNTFYLDHDLHILAYFIDYHSEELRKWLEEIHAEKTIQSMKRIEKLNELGFVFSIDDVKKFSGERIPTGISFLKAIVSRKENRSDERIVRFTDGDRSHSPYVNFYRDYLRGGKPAFVPLKAVETVSVMKRIQSWGGIPVLAHPSDTGDAIILDLIKEGLPGLEVFSSYHSHQEEEHLLALAKENNLLATAGSDFHGSTIKPDVTLGGIRGNSYELLEKLKGAHAHLQK